jgi:hypothetical protein
MALSTRPSQPCDGRTEPATEVTIARQPRRTPSSAPNGITKADHLTGDRAVIAGLDQQPRPDRHGVDRSRDLDHQPAHPDHPAVNLDPVELGDLFGQGFHVAA